MLISLCVELADAASADKVHNLCIPFPGEWDLVGAVWTPSSAGAAAIDATDYRAITVKNGSTSVAAVTTFTGGSAFVAATPVSMTVTASRFTGLTDAVIVDSTHTGGTGKVANGLVTLGFRKAAND